MEQILDGEWQQMVSAWLREREMSWASHCRQAGLSETHFSHQMHGRKGITDKALRSVERVMGLDPDTLVNLKRVSNGNAG